MILSSTDRRTSTGNATGQVARSSRGVPVDRPVLVLTEVLKHDHRGEHALAEAHRVANGRQRRRPPGLSAGCCRDAPAGLALLESPRGETVLNVAGCEGPLDVLPPLFREQSSPKSANPLPCSRAPPAITWSARSTTAWRNDGAVDRAETWLAGAGLTGFGRDRAGTGGAAAVPADPLIVGDPGGRRFDHCRTGSPPAAQVRFCATAPEPVRREPEPVRFTGRGGAEGGQRPRARRSRPAGSERSTRMRR